MVEIFLLACLSAAPAQCDEFVIPLHPDVSLFACQIGVAAMPTLAEWQAQHPKRFVARYECRPHQLPL
jgi:hypothetical protein